MTSGRIVLAQRQAVNNSAAEAEKSDVTSDLLFVENVCRL